MAWIFQGMWRRRKNIVITFWDTYLGPKMGGDGENSFTKYINMIFQVGLNSLKVQCYLILLSILPGVSNWWPTSWILACCCFLCIEFLGQWLSRTEWGLCPSTDICISQFTTAPRWPLCLCYWAYMNYLCDSWLSPSPPCMPEPSPPIRLGGGCWLHFPDVLLIACLLSL